MAGKGRRTRCAPRRAGSHPRRRRRHRGPLLPRAGIRYRRAARRDRRRHKPHECFHRRKSHAGLCQLSQSALCRAVRCDRLRQPHQLPSLCRDCGRSFCRERRSRTHLSPADADALALVCGARSSLLRRRCRHGEPQQRQIQRLQGLRRRRLPDHDGGRRSDSVGDRPRRSLCGHPHA